MSMENKLFEKYKKLVKMVNYYPPYFFSGIKVISYNEDFTYFKVRLKLNRFNKNLLGTAFGGSLYSMCDPFFMFILTINLGSGYIVWDKAASINFVKPGKGTVFAEFRLSHEEISRIKSEVDQIGKNIYTFPCKVVDGEGKLVAELSKDIYVRKNAKKSS